MKKPLSYIHLIELWFQRTTTQPENWFSKFVITFNEINKRFTLVYDGKETMRNNGQTRINSQKN